MEENLQGSLFFITSNIMCIIKKFSSDLENSLHRFIYGNEILPANLDSEEINLLAKSSTVSPDSSLRSTSYVHQLNYHTLLEILNKKVYPIAKFLFL